MANLSNLESELLALARKDAREVMKRCDALIERAEEELSKFVQQRRKGRTALAEVTRCKAGRFTFVSMTDPPPLPRRAAANSN